MAVQAEDSNVDRAGLGEFVRAARSRAGLGAAELAQAIARSQTWLYRLEHGERSDPMDVDLDNIAKACGLSTWEHQYLFLLAARWPTVELLDSQPVVAYLDRIPQPTAWITNDEDSHYNAAFLRLFKDADQFRDMVHWQYGHPDAQRILVNWSEIADWWVSTGRTRILVDRHNPAYLKAVELNLKHYPDFRKRWDSQVIPLDPSSRTWFVNDLDRGDQLAIDMRAWRHPYRSGIMLTGFLRDQNPWEVADQSTD